MAGAEPVILISGIPAGNSSIACSDKSKLISIFLVSPFAKAPEKFAITGKFFTFALPLISKPFFVSAKKSKVPSEISMS